MSHDAPTTVRLGRQVRFCLPLDGGEAARTGGPTNNFAGWPRPHGLSPFYAVTAEVAGRTDPASGLLVNIRDIDRVVRDGMLAHIAGRIAADDREPASWLASVWRVLAEPLAAAGIRLAGLTLQWTPFHALSVHGADGMVYLTEQFEFAAAHRLWSERLSEQDNQAAFGKCANPAGHGHNYVVEVTVACPADGPDLGRLERTVRTAAIDRLDHKNLNSDCPQFAELNPTVENIARVIFEMLCEPRALGDALAAVRVYETPKTWAEVRADRENQVSNDPMTE